MWLTIIIVLLLLIIFYCNYRIGAIATVIAAVAIYSEKYILGGDMLGESDITRDRLNRVIRYMIDKDFMPDVYRVPIPACTGISAEWKKGLNVSCIKDAADQLKYKIKTDISSFITDIYTSTIPDKDVYNIVFKLNEYFSRILQAYVRNIDTTVNDIKHLLKRPLSYYDLNIYYKGGNLMTMYFKMFMSFLKPPPTTKGMEAYNEIKSSIQIKRGDWDFGLPLDKLQRNEPAAYPLIKSSLIYLMTYALQELREELLTITNINYNEVVKKYIVEHKQLFDSMLAHNRIVKSVTIYDKQIPDPQNIYSIKRVDPVKHKNILTRNSDNGNVITEFDDILNSVEYKSTERFVVVINSLNIARIYPTKFSLCRLKIANKVVLDTADGSKLDDDVVYGTADLVDVSISEFSMQNEMIHRILDRLGDVPTLRLFYKGRKVVFYSPYELYSDIIVVLAYLNYYTWEDKKYVKRIRRLIYLCCVCMLTKYTTDQTYKYLLDLRDNIKNYNDKYIKVDREPTTDILEKYTREIYLIYARNKLLVDYYYQSKSGTVDPDGLAKRLGDWVFRREPLERYQIDSRKKLSDYSDRDIANLTDFREQLLSGIKTAIKLVLIFRYQFGPDYIFKIPEHVDSYI